MANICWFEMRIRGCKENCYAMVNSEIHCNDACAKAENGTDEDYMICMRGECRGSVWNNMMQVGEGETLYAKARKFNVELEVCGMDETSEVLEHYHYRGAEVLKENHLPPYLMAYEFDENEIGLTPEDMAKYQKIEEQDVYVLKEEFTEHFEFDEESGEPVFHFEMSFRDLSGFEGGEEPNEGTESGGAFESPNLSFMDDPENDQLVLLDCEDCFEVLVIPDGVTFINEAVGYGMDKLKELMIPKSVQVIDFDCFQACKNLEKVTIASAATEISEDSFASCPKLTIYVPAGSCAETYAKEHNIPFVVE
jgi:hypothetical protein